MKTKNLLASTALVIFIAWPIVHRALSEYYDINPWKYFGWAMYTIPVPSSRVHIHVKYGDKWNLVSVTKNISSKVEKYLHKVRTRGELSSPEELANFLFTAPNAPEELLFTVFHKSYNWHSQKYETKKKLIRLDKKMNRLK